MPRAREDEDAAEDAVRARASRIARARGRRARTMRDDER